MSAVITALWYALVMLAAVASIMIAAAHVVASVVVVVRIRAAMAASVMGVSA